jgi:hypothetical protein
MAAKKQKKKAAKTPWVEDLRGKRFAVFGSDDNFPPHLGRNPADALLARGATLVERIAPDLDYVVIAPGRGAGRTEALRKVEAGKATAKYVVLDVPGLLHLLRVDLSAATFFFAGGFERHDPDVPDSHPAALVRSAGASVVDTLDDTVTYAVIGPRRAAGKAAAEQAAVALRAGGAPLAVIDEEGLHSLLRGQLAPAEGSGIGGLLVELNNTHDPKRVRRALDMLKQEKFQLYVDHGDDFLVGVVRSQTSDGVYACGWQKDGRYWCVTPDLATCMGTGPGRVVCKHLMVLALGVAQSGAVAPARVGAWVAAAAGKRPRGDDNRAASTLLRYKGAEAGEVDWRPTETLPEDFYAL